MPFDRLRQYIQEQKVARDAKISQQKVNAQRAEEAQRAWVRQEKERESAAERYLAQSPARKMLKELGAAVQAPDWQIIPSRFWLEARWNFYPDSRRKTSFDYIKVASDSEGILHVIGESQFQVRYDAVQGLEEALETCYLHPGHESPPREFKGIY